MGNSTRRYGGGYAAFVKVNGRWQFEMFSMPGHAHTDRFHALQNVFGDDGVLLRWIWVS